MSLTPTERRRRAASLLEHLRTTYPRDLDLPPQTFMARLPGGTEEEECWNLSAVAQMCERLIRADDETLNLLEYQAGEG